jgi:protein-S-isoprenylcysteine O-methyltransferase Ste14
MDHPLLIALVSFVALFACTNIAAKAHRKGRLLNEDERADLDLITNSTLTLLALLIGFTFSMAMNRYDLRKQYEEAEANAIGTEYNRIGLLPRSDEINVRALLKRYLEQRLLFYTTRDTRQLEEIEACTDRIQVDLWSAIETSAAAERTMTIPLVAGGMNEVLDSQGRTQAAWWNRIPVAAWSLMGAVAVWASLLVGYTARHPERKLWLAILPLILATAFFLIADLDSPRGGIILVHPHNLESLSRFIDRQYAIAPVK